MCVGRCVTSQWTVLGFVLGEDGLNSTELLPHIYQVLPQSRILFLQESGPAGDLVLFDPPCVSGAFGCQVVLPASGPVFVILPQKEQKRTGCDKGRQESRKLPFSQLAPLCREGIFLISKLGQKKALQTVLKKEQQKEKALINLRFVLT